MKRHFSKRYLAAHHPNLLLWMERCREGEFIKDGSKEVKALERFLRSEGFAKAPWSFSIDDMGGFTVRQPIPGYALGKGPE